jgi:hypothetical protein
VTSTRNSPLADFYWKTKQKRGAKKAVIALSRKLMVIVYHLLKNNDVYQAQKFEKNIEKREINRLKRLSSEAKKLGYKLVINEPEKDM